MMALVVAEVRSVYVHSLVNASPLAGRPAEHARAFYVRAATLCYRRSQAGPKVMFYRVTPAQLRPECGGRIGGACPKPP
jgi:hypothetical protein